MKDQKGFTLMELLIVIAILGILAVLSFGNYFTSLKKGRDAKRKADLENIKKAVELYYNDKGRYPPSSEGKIACCGWGEEFVVDETVYMQQLPLDPKNPTYTYYYLTDDKGSYFKLYACLENDQDPKRIVPNETVNCGGDCGESCNYGISSVNALPCDLPCPTPTP